MKHLFKKFPIIQMAKVQISRDKGQAQSILNIILMDFHHYLANYELEQEIGQGSFATVYLGHEKVKN